MNDGAQTDPSLNKTEHIDEDISAKRVVPYYWNGTNLVREGTKLTNKFDVSSPPVFYVGEAPIGTATSTANWTIQKFDLTDLANINGAIATNTAWTNRASGTYT